MLKRTQSYRLRVFILLWILLLPVASWADVGKVIFVSGDVRLADGRPLERGTMLQQGDEVMTGEDGRVQLLMQDGDRIAIRPNSRFLIETYEGPDTSGPASANGQIETRRVYNLLKGGFRTLTNKDGARDEDNYRVKTPVATIGIRGTDYELLLQQLAAGVGLYIGVHDGVIWVRNNAIYTDVYDGEYFYLESQDDPGVKLLAPPELFSEGEVPTTGFWKAAQTAGVEGEGGSYESRRSPSFTPSGDPDPDPSSDPEIPILVVNPLGETVLLNDAVLPRFRYHAFASGPLGIAEGFSGAALSAIEGLQLDADGNLVRFPGLYPSGSGPALAFYEQGTSSVVNTGADPVTGLRWGRWAGGEATITHGAGSESIDLSNQSLHWIVSPETLEPVALPVSGVAEYRLVGNTDPTDNLGNVGFLDGTSHMQADFTNQTIATDIRLGINSQQWHAQDANGSFGQNGSFAGQFDSVQVTGGQCGSGCSGDGGYSGFFTGGNGSGPPPGAGMGYNMQQGGQAVSGTAAFGDPAPVNP